MKAVEAAGLSNIIMVLASIITTLLIVSMGNIMASPGLGLLVIKKFDVYNATHLVLAAVNVMALWVLAVRSLGLARLSGASIAKSAICIFGLWILWKALSIGYAVGMQALMSHAAAKG
jgi:hypothetical protein